MDENEISKIIVDAAIEVHQRHSSSRQWVVRYNAKTPGREGAKELKKPCVSAS